MLLTFQISFQKMKNTLLGLLLVVGTHLMHAQSIIPIERTIEWAAGPSKHTLVSGEVVTFWEFKNATYSDATPTIPVFSERIPLASRSELTVEVTSMQFESFSFQPNGDDAALDTDVRVEITLEQERKRFLHGCV